MGVCMGNSLEGEQSNPTCFLHYSFPNLSGRCSLASAFWRCLLGRCFLRKFSPRDKFARTVVISTKTCLTFFFFFFFVAQFQKDAKDAQDLLRKVDTDLDQKYSPDFKDRFQIELLLRELEASTPPHTHTTAWQTTAMLCEKSRS